METTDFKNSSKLVNIKYKRDVSTCNNVNRVSYLRHITSIIIEKNVHSILLVNFLIIMRLLQEPIIELSNTLISKFDN